MSKVRIELNSAGVRALLKSAEMEAGLQELAGGIRDGCGEGYGQDTRQMPTRVIASVFTETEAAEQDNLENNTILRRLLP
jgi:hypothetical protein